MKDPKMANLTCTGSTIDGEVSNVGSSTSTVTGVVTQFNGTDC